MDALAAAVGKLNGVVWGPAMLALILGTGLVLQIGLRAVPLRKLGMAFRMLWAGRGAVRAGSPAGDLSPFNALMTSLSATIGTGNIAGVGTAVFIGGPGALFWMWCTALVGMATKYAEAVCAVRFREVDARGHQIGGPMYYIKNGLSPGWAWLAPLFAVFGALAGFGIGNTVQANSVAAVAATHLGLPPWVTGVVMMVLVGGVLIGGIERIGTVAGKLVPFMAGSYLLAGLVVLAIHASAIPGALVTIVEHAFSATAATGGFAGAAVWTAMRLGVARGIFSNEAGLGSAPIAHATAATRGPVDQGLVAMLGTFLDTLVICSITGLAIVASGVWTSGATGAELTAAAFESALPGIGAYVVAFSLALFAFTTVLGWSFYGEKCVQYLFGIRSVLPFRLLWVIVIPIGASADLGFLWLLADTLNALMAIPNLIALLLLAPLVFRVTREYFDDRP
jgi:AGCS family alanine or glycine:cation symporter